MSKGIYSKSNFMFFLTGFITFLSLILISSMAYAQNEKYEKNTLEVTGRGEIKIKPDTAYLTLSVETTAKKASDAVKENAERMKSVLDKLKSQIGKGDKISTTGYQLYPLYDYNDKTKKTELTGYRASNNVVVETKNLNDLGKLIDSATQAGANRIDNLSFSSDKKEQYRKEALAKAVQDAKETAEIVAGASGVKIVRILKISPSYEVPTPVYRDFGVQKLAAAEAAPTQIEAGELTVSGTVNVVYEIQ
jgi:uncharacterized protein YggE